MKRLIPFIIVSCIPFLSANPAQACQSDTSGEIFGALQKWVCELDTVLIRKDQFKDYVRQLHLVTNKEAIKVTRVLIAANDDEVCRIYPAADAVLILKRILGHQGVADTFAGVLSQSAAVEIAAAGSGRSVTNCESQTLFIDGVEKSYTNYYYIKFGSARQGKHLIIKVVTSWDN